MTCWSWVRIRKQPLCICKSKAAYNIPLPYLRITKSLWAMGYEVFFYTFTPVPWLMYIDEIMEMHVFWNFIPVFIMSCITESFLKCLKVFDGCDIQYACTKRCDYVCPNLLLNICVWSVGENRCNFKKTFLPILLFWEIVYFKYLMLSTSILNTFSWTNVQKD